MELAEAPAERPQAGSSVALQPCETEAQAMAASLLVSNSLHSDQTEADAVPPVQAAPPRESGPRRKPGRPAREKACMVCGMLLPQGKVSPYFRRYRVCAEHRDALSVPLRGQNQRFCQQCGTFHPLAKFTGNRRSCRERLHKHAVRRRKGSDGDGGCLSFGWWEQGADQEAAAAAAQAEGPEAGTMDAASAGSEGSAHLRSQGSGNASPPPHKRHCGSGRSASSEGAPEAQPPQPEPRVVVAVAPAAATTAKQDSEQLAPVLAASPKTAVHRLEWTGRQAAVGAPAGCHWMPAWSDPGWSTTAGGLPDRQLMQQARQVSWVGSSCTLTVGAPAGAAAADNPLSALAAAAEEEQAHEQQELLQHAQAPAHPVAPPASPSAGAAAAAALLLQHAEAQRSADRGAAHDARPCVTTAPRGDQQPTLRSCAPTLGAGSTDLLAAATTAIASVAAATVPGQPATVLQVLLAGSAQGQGPHPTAAAAALLAVQREQQRQRQAAQQQQLLLSLLTGMQVRSSQQAAMGCPLPQAQLLAPLLPLLPQLLHAQGSRAHPAPAAVASTTCQQHQQAALVKAVPLPLMAPGQWQPQQAVPPLQGAHVGALPAAPAGTAWGGFPVTTGAAAGPRPCPRGQGL
ncbi:hypothetical protein ABPG77_008257 [Micractinium sp. CCAP 211/92]